LLKRNEVCRKYKDNDHLHNAGLFLLSYFKSQLGLGRRITGTGQVTDC